MRSSKSRQRSKSNRPRTLGNITNRVFDSSGPEGKVRGTPQQIIDKYNQLSRDAQLSNDRVNAENFLQHAEHYTRMLGEATREMQAEQDQRRQYDSQNGSHNSGNATGQNGQQGNGQQRDYAQRDRGEGQQPDQRDDRNDGGRDDRQDNRQDNRGENRQDNRNDNRQNAQADSRQTPPREERNPDRAFERNNDRRNRQVNRPDAAVAPEVIDPKAGEDDNGLVETPETRRPRQHRAPRPRPGGEASPPNAEVAAQPKAQATETAKDNAAPKPRAPQAEAEGEKPRKPRVARKPKPDAEPDSGPSSGPSSGNEAAE